MFHVTFKPTSAEGVCDACGGKTHQRADDNEKSIKIRLAVYCKSTAPLIQFYAKRGLLEEVQGNGTPAEVTTRIKTVLGVS
jgi:adenylate kinase